jgi:Flp pilus assembly protein TadG
MKPYRHRGSKQSRGAAATEFIIVFPALIFLVFGIIQWGLIYQARATLNYATLLAARAGAVQNGSKAEMRKGLAAGLAPLFASEASIEGVTKARAKAFAEISVLNLAQIEVLNPTLKAMNDFGRPKLDGTSGTELPNDTLNYRNQSPGASSGVSVQDANILHVRVTYCYRMIVPVVGRMIEAVSHAIGPFAYSLQAHGMSDPFGIGSPLILDPLCTRPLAGGPRIKIQSEAVVRMQSPLDKKNL